MVTLKNIVRKSKSPLPFKKTDPCTILPSPFIVYWILLEGRQKRGVQHFMMNNIDTYT